MLNGLLKRFKEFKHIVFDTESYSYIFDVEDIKNVSVTSDGNYLILESESDLDFLNLDSFKRVYFTKRTYNRKKKRWMD